MTATSLSAIGKILGRKDHTTVMHSVDKIKKELKTNQILEMEIQKIVNQIK